MRFREADRWPLEDCLEAMWEHSLHAFAAVRAALPALARAVRAAAERLADDEGRLVYVGAGSSGRIAVQDGVELWPTFSWPQTRVAFALAGGERALSRALEGAEDDARAGIEAMRRLDLGPRDVQLALAASGRTPFVLAAQREARRRRALTVAFANNPGAPLLARAECPVLLATGAEFLAGSTRMNAGTAQKIALNLFSTQLMFALGRVYEGRMVALVPTSTKLEARALGILRELTGAGEEAAREAFANAGRDLRLAVLLLDGLTLEEARERLARAGGNLRRARASG